MRVGLPIERRSRDELAGRTVSIPAYAGYLALFLWIFLAEAGVPLVVPTELVLVAAGIAAAQGSASLPVAICIALGADLLGTVTMFALVRRFGRAPVGPQFVGRFVEWATVKARAAGAEQAIRVAVGRSIPFLRIPSASAAALTDLAPSRYVAASLVGGTVWISLFLDGAYLVTARSLDLA